jgi:hypothetical protein
MSKREENLLLVASYQSNLNIKQSLYYQRAQSAWIQQKIII